MENDIGTSIKKPSSVGGRGYHILVYFILCGYQIVYLFGSYGIPVVLIISGVKAMFASKYLFDASDNIKKEYNTHSDTNLIMTVIYFTVAISILQYKW